VASRTAFQPLRGDGFGDGRSAPEGRFAEETGVTAGVCPVFQQNGFTLRMRFEDSDRFRATVTPKANDAYGYLHGYLFIRMNNYTKWRSQSSRVTGILSLSESRFATSFDIFRRPARISVVNPLFPR